MPILCVLTLAALPASVRAYPPEFHQLALTAFRRPMPAPTFDVATPNGALLRLADYRGRVVLLSFWATWCPPCIREMPSLERLHQSLQGRGLVVLAVSLDREGAVTVLPFVQRLALTFPVALDPEGRVGALYGAADLPSTFLIDRQGRVVAAAKGGRDWFSPQARSYVEELLAAGGS
ncbi:MAG: TlpA family protein disulfide reductase [Candidatus Lambdaproteobacteria bacterium]|nr:TlpA family protein disulfide reductase [Candidatus Lambdaproteobacteria bacterium]